MPDPDIATTKAQLRQEGFARRDALSREARHDASLRIAEHVNALPELAGVEPVGFYWPIRTEVDPRPIAEVIVAAGRIAALAQIRHPDLSWREWQPGDQLVHGGFGVQEPGPDAAEVYPHALLVPLCAFDRRGGRLGYGKGHFDRALAALTERHGRVLAIGLAFSVQEIAEVPQDRFDRRLDAVVTEREVIRP